uniref:Iroquois-class homeodomain protein irx-3 n=1 Tax=Xenopus tropicalis TaxID=8364 RepID=A0A5S6KT41_XENTR
MESLSAAPTINTVLECTLKDDLQALKLLFEDPSEPEKVTDLLLKKDFMGRNVLFPACILGRCEVVKELIKYGASVNSLTSRGYSPLHCAAAWGQLDMLKTLVEMGADIKACNFCNEKAYEIAIRYNKTECADFLAWAEAKLELKIYISFVHQSITDLEKLQGKLNKEYKVCKQHIQINKRECKVCRNNWNIIKIKSFFIVICIQIPQSYARHGIIKVNKPDEWYGCHLSGVNHSCHLRQCCPTGGPLCVAPHLSGCFDNLPL